jgi:hypothetical protein
MRTINNEDFKTFGSFLTNFVDGLPTIVPATERCIRRWEHGRLTQKWHAVT